MREQIVTVAEKLIRTEGLAHATTRSIAMHAGCSEGTIYRHFRSKEDVFIAVVQERLPKFAAVMQSVAGEPGTGDVRARLSALMRAVLDFYQVTIPVNVAIFAEPQMLSQHRNWMQEHNVGPHRGVELVAEYIEKEQAIGRIRASASPSAAASVMLGSCYLRAYSKQFADVTPRSDNKFIADTIALLFQGMDAPAAGA
jgi:AcrR family transcriptional regulator